MVFHKKRIFRITNSNPNNPHRVNIAISPVTKTSMEKNVNKIANALIKTPSRVTTYQERATVYQDSKRQKRITGTKSYTYKLLFFIEFAVSGTF